MKIVVQSAEAKSLKDIARDSMVSPPTAQCIINETAAFYQPNYTVLPKHLSFDEFKYEKGKMTFECINWTTGDIIDILDKRISRVSSDYFIANNSLKDCKKLSR